MKPYTYVLRHRPTGKRYYGVRFAKDCDPSDLWVTYFSSSGVIHDLNKDDFDVEVRKVFDTRKEALDWEAEVIYRARLWKNPMWFNKAVPGRRVRFGPHSIESKAKMSASRKGKPAWNKGRKTGPGKKRTPEQCARMGRHWIGKHHTLETKALMSMSRKGVPKSEEFKRQVSASTKGIPKSEETKAKMKKPKSTEHRLKISLANKGRKHTEATKKKLRLAAKNRPRRKHSEETKAKMAEARRLYWINRNI